MSDRLKILVTGSCGFIFSNFLRKVVYEKKPYQLISIDRVNFSSVNSMYWNKNHTFYVADIRDQHIIDTIFKLEKPDVVIHGAAETFVDSSLIDPNSFVTTNVLGTQVISNACVKNDVKKLIYISTDEVYGQLKSEEDLSWTEDSVLNPRNPYAATKASGEFIVKAAHESFGLNYNITRCSNNYGPRQNTEKLIPKTIKCILNGQKIPIYGKGLQIRDWTYVYDNCQAIFSILENGVDNEVYNISSNQELTNVEIIQNICNALGKGHDLMSFIEDPRKNAHDFRYSVDSSKIRSLGWKPSFKLKDGINQTIDWYINNQWYLK